MKAVLSLCDYTANMVRPWAEAGYVCWIVDLQHPAGISHEGNIVRVGADLLTWQPPPINFSFISAFPPCTDLAVSGSRHFQKKGLTALIEALKIVDACRLICEKSGSPYFLENPVSTISSYWRKPDYIFNPCDYGGYLTPPGDAYTKKTCLWTGGGFVMPAKKSVEPVKVCEQGSWVQKLGGKSQRTKNLRSATPMGFARAVFEANSASA